MKNKVLLFGHKIKMLTYHNDKGTFPATLIKISDLHILKILYENEEIISLLVFYHSSRKLNKPQGWQVHKLSQKKQAKYGTVSRINLPIKFYNFLKKNKNISIITLREIEQYSKNEILNLEYIDIVGKTKGKGFCGVMKKFHFSGGPASHGSTKFHRKGGSLAKKIWKGKKMPGRLGNSLRYCKNLEILKIFSNQNLLVIKGSVLGNSFSILKCWFKFYSREVIKTFFHGKIEFTKLEWKNI